MMRWHVVCVLKTGGDFKVDCVLRLKEMVDRRFQDEHDFSCLTDAYIPGVQCILLQQGWAGWWSKLELFCLWNMGLHEPVLYLDLDTVITAPFTLPVPAEGELYMLRDFLAWGKEEWKSRWWASGIMMWNTDLGFIFERALKEGFGYFSKYYEWDQIFIGKAVRDQGKILMKAIDDVCVVRSYKIHRLAHEMLGNDVQIVCFHGKPRPWDVETPWVKELWHGSPSD